MNTSSISSSQKIAPHPRLNIVLLLLSLLLSIGFSSAALAQEDESDAAPPPVKIMPKTEKDELAAEATLKDRTRATLELMGGHIAAAERLSNDHDANGAFKELGMFEALMDDSVGYLSHKDTNSNKTLDALRKLEIGLREFMPRLETIRRLLPLNCDDYVRKLMKNLRDARAKAVDPMFSDGVVKATAKNP